MISIIRADLHNTTHAEALVNLLSEYALDEMGGRHGLSSYTKTHLAATLKAREKTYVVLAYSDNKAVGLITCIEGFSTFQCRPLLNIHDVFVTKDYRGRSISTLLLNEAKKIAIETNCCKLTLEVLEGNTTARTAYNSYGFSGYELNPEMGKALFWEKKL